MDAARGPWMSVVPTSEARATRLCFDTEDSPSGLWRTLGKRVGFTPSRVRIPHPPLSEQHERPDYPLQRDPGVRVRSQSPCGPAPDIHDRPGTAPLAATPPRPLVASRDPPFRVTSF